MVKVEDNFIRYKESGYQHVGRVVAGLHVFSKKIACLPPYFCIKNTGRDERDGDGVDETSEPGQDLDINNFTLEDVNEFISLLLPFVDPLQFNPVLKYSAACTTLPRQRYVFVQTLYYYVFLHCSTDISYLK